MDGDLHLLHPRRPEKTPECLAGAQREPRTKLLDASKQQQVFFWAQHLYHKMQDVSWA